MRECSTDGISCHPQMALILKMSLNRTTDFFEEHWQNHFTQTQNTSVPAIYDLDHYTYNGSIAYKLCGNCMHQAQYASL